MFGSLYYHSTLDPSNPENEEGTTEDAIKDAAPEEAEVLSSG